MINTPEKPLFASRLVIIYLPLVILVTSWLLTFFFGVKQLDRLFIDKLFHVIGGFSASMSVAGVIWHLDTRQLLVVNFTVVFYVLIYGCLSFIIISWEIAEYLLFQEFMTYSDTISDMVFSLFGGLCALLAISRINYRLNN